MMKTQDNNNEITTNIQMLVVFLIPAIALIIGTTAQKSWADDPVCWWNIEFNASDLDVGVRGFFDYEPWKELEVENPRGKTIAEVEGKRSMKRQGFAEWFFESGEPTLFEVPFRKFLRRFPAGPYELEAETIRSSEVECTAELTHVIPCAPEIDVEQINGSISITWEPVDTTVNTSATDANAADPAVDPDDFEADELLDCSGPAPIIVGYEVIVEEEDSEKIFKIDLQEDDTSVTIPPEFLALGDTFKYEVLAIEESGNQTITEDEFCLDEDRSILDECPAEE